MVSKKYSGELLDIESLKPVIVGSYTSIDYNDTLHYKDKEIVDGSVSAVKVYKQDIIEGNLEYIIFGNINTQFDLEDITSLNELRECLGMNSAKDRVNKSINGVTHNVMGTPIHINKTDKCSLVEYEDRLKNISDNLSEEEIDKIVEDIKKYGTKIYRNYALKGKYIALARKVGNVGISYDVLVSHTDVHISYEKAKHIVEDIYTNYQDYGNVTVDGKIMTIQGLDGTYKYDMDKIYKEYNRYAIPSSRKIKANLVDPLYKETITAKGELREIETGRSSTLIIPKDVKRVLAKSININQNTSRIVFGDTIEYCNKACIATEYEYFAYKAFKYLEIGTSNVVATQILQAFNKQSMFKNVEVTFSRDINAKEYAYIIYNRVYSNNIKAPNLINMQKGFIVKVMDEIIKSKLGNFSILENPIEYTVEQRGEKLVCLTNIEYRRFIKRYEQLKSLWADILKSHADTDLSNKIDSILKDIDKKIVFRKKELKKSAKSVKEGLV